MAHHDVKPANVFIDASSGGKLLLGDWGTACKPGEEAVGFTKSYASPELLAAYESDDFAGMRPDYVDSFALGAVLYELLIGKKLEGLSGDGSETLASFVASSGVEAAMNIDHVALPWVPSGHVGEVVGYTYELKNLVMNFLKPDPSERLLPGQLRGALRTDPLSPLLLPYVTAAESAKPGDVITIDNIQLGLLVQRGPDWADGDDDGGKGSIGVVVKLDGDATYADVAFPSRSFAQKVATICCRIGASGKHELRVGPIPMPDFVAGSASMRNDGIINLGKDAINMHIGQMLNENCMVVGTDQSLGMAFGAPMQQLSTPEGSKPSIWRMSNESFVISHEETCPPETWQLNLGTLVNVMNSEEGCGVMDRFYSQQGGVNQQLFPVKSIQRVQGKCSYFTSS